jgi:hypothetical protein
MSEVETLKAALKWVMENGATWSSHSKVFYDMGCGCCAAPIEVPSELEGVIREAAGLPPRTGD